MFEGGALAAKIAGLGFSEGSFLNASPSAEMHSKIAEKRFQILKFAA